MSTGIRTNIVDSERVAGLARRGLRQHALGIRWALRTGGGSRGRKVRAGTRSRAAPIWRGCKGAVAMRAGSAPVGVPPVM